MNPYKITGVILAFIVGFLGAELYREKQNNKDVTASTEASYFEVEMNVSAYCSGECCCGDFADGITASGVPAVGKMIAAPKTYAFGTKMDIPGYGTALVQDRGGAIKGNKLDLLFESHDAALNWGRKQLTVKVYKLGGAK